MSAQHRGGGIRQDTAGRLFSEKALPLYPNEGEMEIWERRDCKEDNEPPSTLEERTMCNEWSE